MVSKKAFLSLIKTLLYGFFLSINLIGFSQNTFIPDDNFEQALIDLGYDVGPLDDFVPTANISAIANLGNNLEGKNISDLTGIEDFINLSVLNCINNNLSSLNVTQNTKLTQLFCGNNMLTGLDVTKNSVLSILWCDNNQLTDLNVNNNIDLISLVCSDNLLKNLDISPNTNLNVLSCENNELTTLDITQNITLSRLSCDYNFLTSLDTSKNAELNTLNCGDNMMSSLDLSQNKKLVILWSIRNQLTTLDVTQNKELVQLLFGDNQITNIDLSQNSKLEELRCGRNFLKTLDVSKNSSLVNLSCSLNLLCSLNVKNGNNSNFTLFIARSNPDLSCIFVDDVAYSTSNWTFIDANSNFVTNQADCENFEPKPAVDSLNDFLGNSYILPILNNGNYFTQSGGTGLKLNAGDTITTSQIIYIYNEIGCANNESNFKVTTDNNGFFIPKYFTPNNDGNHDVWKVVDNTNTVESITIYNRYGKLLKYLLPNSQGWNGTFDGKLLVSDDYWYVITFFSGEILKGHFALKK